MINCAAKCLFLTHKKIPKIKKWGGTGRLSYFWKLLLYFLSDKKLIYRKKCKLSSRGVKGHVKRMEKQEEGGRGRRNQQWLDGPVTTHPESRFNKADPNGFDLM